jgi:alkyl sulfatase BDS1-like metallo-beta-lactamase superfamily hydrolase
MNDVVPGVHPELANQIAEMQPRIYTFGGHIHLAFAHAPSNCTLIEGEDACILVDTLSTLEYAQPVATIFRSMTEKPIRTVIYTHFHIDHVSGISAFVSPDDIKRGDVELIGHESLTANLAKDGGLVAAIMGRRALFQFGYQLPVGEDGYVGTGIGGLNVHGTRDFIVPTRTVKSRLDLKISGLNVSLIHLPSETEDQLVVWLPDEKVLISADIIQGESFPNIYAIRGTRFRSPMQWVKAIDAMRALPVETLIPHHGHPVQGRAQIDDLLTAYRDAMQYMHDQTVRYMNKGYRPDEIADVVTMPSHLASHPWLGEYYGTYKHCLKNVYTGYLGWYQGDPTELDPLPWRERARRYIAQMGGRNSILRSARDAIARGEPMWAADLLTWAIRADLNDQEARLLKATALRKWAYAQKNATWRNAGLTAALELEGRLQLSQKGLPLGTPKQVQNFPLSDIVELMTVRLMAEQALDDHIIVAFEAIDTNERCALELRHGVCQFHDILPERVDATIRFDRTFLTRWTFGETSYREGVAAGHLQVNGDAARADLFFSRFEPISASGLVAVSVR